MIVTVVSGEAKWRQALEAGLRARGFDALAVYEEGEEPWPRPRAQPLVFLIDAHVPPYGATELATQLRTLLGERCPVLVCLGDPAEAYDGELFAARTERPDNAFALLDELEHLLPRVVGMGSGYSVHLADQNNPGNGGEATG